MKDKASMDDFLKTFHIGTYYLQKNARSERHIKDLRDCGIDLVLGMDDDKNALELFQKYGIHAVLGGIVPGWFGGHGENAGTLRTKNRPEAYIDGAKAFANHPAVVGIDLGDEPSSLDFPYYSELIKLNRELFPGKFLYLNLYPSYGMLSSNTPAQAALELGKDAYTDYLKVYCETVALPYLSFDHYVYSSNTELFLQDLYHAASFCKMYRKKLFIVLQVNSHQKGVFLREDQLRFQAFSALAFGAGCISWACYSAGWWYNHVLDEAGEKTAQYKKLKTVNTQIRPFGKEIHSCQWKNTLLLEVDHSCDVEDFSYITASVPALLGIFTDETGKAALFFSPLDYESSGPCILCFQHSGKEPLFCRTVAGKTFLSPHKDNRYLLPFDHPQPCLITFAQP